MSGGVSLTLKVNEKNLPAETATLGRRSVPPMTAVLLKTLHPTVLPLRLL